jgi:integrase
MAIEEISRLVGHSSSNVTETVYRHQIRPVITVGAEAMDKIIARVRRIQPTLEAEKFKTWSGACD